MRNHVNKNLKLVSLFKNAMKNSHYSRKMTNNTSIMHALIQLFENNMGFKPQ